MSNGTRCIFSGGQVAPGASNVIDYITIASTGDATDFGDLQTARKAAAGDSDSGGHLQG